MCCELCETFSNYVSTIIISRISKRSSRIHRSYETLTRGNQNNIIEITDIFYKCSF